MLYTHMLTYNSGHLLTANAFWQKDFDLIGIHGSFSDGHITVVHTCALTHECIDRHVAYVHVCMHILRYRLAKRSRSVYTVEVGLVRKSTNLIKNLILVQVKQRRKQLMNQPKSKHSIDRSNKLLD